MIKEKLDLQLDKRIPILDSIRGLACLLVVVSHLIEMTLHSKDYALVGGVGVLIFFSLSGFLIGHLYIESKLNSISLKKYLISRFSRIVPAYYLAILVYLLIDHFIYPYYDMSVVNILRSLMFLSSVGVFWSIGPEVQFYLYFCAIWLCVYYSNNSKLSVKLAIVAFTALTLILLCTRAEWPGILLPSKLHIFLFGILSALFFRRLRASNTFLKHYNWLTLLIVATSSLYFSKFISIDTVFSDLILSVIVALIIGLLSVNVKLTQLLSNKALGFVGEASFSIYLFHGPILRLLDSYVLTFQQASELKLLIPAFIAIAIPSVFHLTAEKALNAKVKNSLNKYFIKNQN